MWTVIYHPEVTGDLEILGYAEARRILKVIEERIRKGEPDKLGKPLHGTLSYCRRLRVGNTRIVYKVNKNKIEIFILAGGPRRDEEVYAIADKRYQK